MHLCSKTNWPSFLIDGKLSSPTYIGAINSLNDYVWVVWQHWIIHAYLIAVYEGFIGRWCIKRANPCLGCCSSNSTGKVPFTVCEVTLNSHWGILICLFSSLFFIILHLCLYLWPCSTCLLSICQIFFFLLLLLLHKTGDTGMKSMPTSLNLPAYTICGPWLVSPSNGI